MAKKKSRRRPIRALVNLSVEARLIAGLDPLTARDLIAMPPSDDESMQAVGISATNLDTTVRTWINGAFRTPAGLDPLVPGSITSGTKWKKLVEMCG